jgi:hypothetical protein
MTPTTAEQALVNEERWQKWVAKGKAHDKATARKFKRVAGVVLILAALAIVYYLFWMK